ncbi:hypothetical protein [Thermotalea metallivorans]|uniref:Uncharacterized protein n=1 Tax=Thermotalea metallivorans TaxID=520762 RepID=A0A140L7I2_9FIRM|nr:hypothetical protein [Thermotalea metallivorans]KXG76507.1 hypothetical protein AN619_10380 [Thermotalea metallivorans]
MKQSDHGCIKEGFLGAEILHSSTKCKKGIYQVIFAGAEKIHCRDQWKINFIFSFVCPSDKGQDVGCQAASSANMQVVVAPGESIRFERYLGILKKETIEYGIEDYGLCERFFPVRSIKFLEIETDFIRYEIHCI